MFVINIKFNLCLVKGVLVIKIQQLEINFLVSKFHFKSDKTHTLSLFRVNRTYAIVL